MKSKFTFTIFFIFYLCILIVSCGKKEQKAKEFVVLESDTITVEKLSELSPDTILTPKKIKQLAFMVAITKPLPKPADTTIYKEIINDLVDQLSRESGFNWTADEAELLYRASKIIKEKFETATDIHDLKPFIDSIVAGIIISSDDSSYSFSFDFESLPTDTSFKGKKRQLALIFYSLFGLKKDLSIIITDFLYSENILVLDSSDSDIDNLIKGLVFDSTSIVQRTAFKSRRVPARRDNSALALKYRSQQSIQNTISKHIPNLKAIYKKELKVHPDMSGIVYVTFRVDLSGKIISATIKSSQIDNSKFLNPFIDYVKRINFKSIPENIGNMTFDFPFEFKPELE